MSEADRYLHLRIVHPLNDIDDVARVGLGPTRFAGRKIVLQVVDGENIIGYLGGVLSVVERFPLDGIMNLELTVAGFYEATDDVQWPTWKQKEEVPPPDDVAVVYMDELPKEDE